MLSHESLTDPGCLDTYIRYSEERAPSASIPPVSLRESNMPHTFTYNSELHILELTVQGDLFFGEAKQMMLEAAEMAKKHDCFRILSDYRNSNIRLSTLEIYNIPGMFREIFAAADVPTFKLRRALIATKEMQDLEFFETVTMNRGQNIKLFQDEREAKEWLLQ